jgi:hypothetical protein
MNAPIVDAAPKHIPAPWDCVEGRTLIHVETHPAHPSGHIPLFSVPIARKAEVDFLLSAVNSHDGLVVRIAQLERDRARLIEALKKAHAFIDKIPVSHMKGTPAQRVREDCVAALSSLEAK